MKKTAAAKQPNLVRDAKRWFDRAQAGYAYGPGMQQLLAMCRKYPDHSDLNATISKLWLIGRSHAAALERRRSAAWPANPYPRTARRMRNGRLDRLLAELRAEGPAFSAGYLEAAAAAVEHLTTIFKSTTGLRKHSLASKYLHFHETRLPILDSITFQGLRSLIGKSDLRKDLLPLWKRDGYARHVARMAAAAELLEQAGFTPVTARSLDVFLLYR